MSKFSTIIVYESMPGVRYVVDCGRQKEKIIKEGTAIASYEVRWISKASAEQRKGNITSQNDPKQRKQTTPKQSTPKQTQNNPKITPKQPQNNPKGRSGRTGPGHCYRLFSSAFYDQHMQVDLSRLNPNLTQLNPKLSQLNPKLSQLNPNLSQLNPNLSQLNQNLSQLNPDLSQLNPAFYN